MKLRVLTFLLLSIATLVSNGASSIGATTDNIVTCGMLQNPVVIDGKWTTSVEWSDTAEIVLTKSSRYNYYVQSGEAYCRVKRDDNYLYVLLDSVSDTKAGRVVSSGNARAWDYLSFFIDVNNDGGWHPQTDDVHYRATWSTGSVLYEARAGELNNCSDMRGTVFDRLFFLGL